MLHSVACSNTLHRSARVPGAISRRDRKLRSSGTGGGLEVGRTSIRRISNAKAQGRKEMPQDRSITLPTFASLRLCAFALNSSHGIEYLLTWNCKHLANAQISRRIAALCARDGFQMPTICTPEELLEETADAE